MLKICKKIPFFMKKMLIQIYNFATKIDYFSLMFQAQNITL